MEEKILVVDDSETQAAFLRNVLEEASYHVDIASTGEDGLARVRAAAPDLVLLDVRLPGISGHDVCQALRGDPATFALPIIMLTELEDVPAEIRGLQNGADDYVGKSQPFDMLMARIRRLLDRTRVYRKLSEQERLNLLSKAAFTITHGVNNPLQVVFLSLELLERRPDQDATTVRALGNVRRYVARIAKLVKNIDRVSVVAKESYIEHRALVDLEFALEEAELLAKADEEWKL